jgi:hypothetical protein
MPVPQMMRDGLKFSSCDLAGQADSPANLDLQMTNGLPAGSPLVLLRYQMAWSGSCME